MPFRINGIGTGYYGRRESTKVQGACGFCGRRTWIRSYLTREWFCVFFIPLIPLRQLWITSYCTICRRHYRMNLAERSQLLAREIAPLRQAAERSPADPAAQAGLVEALMRLQMYGEAERVARAGLAAIPASGALSQLVGQLTALRGDAAGATEFLSQAATSQPASAPAHLALGRHLLATKRYGEAVEELRKAQWLDPANSEITVLIAQAMVSEKRWNEALAALEPLRQGASPLAANRQVLALAAECKRRLGLPLSEQERRATRWSWLMPWRRGAAAASKPQSSAKRLLILTGMGCVLCATALTAAALWHQWRIDVYFDNGLAAAVQVVLDGSTFELGPGHPALRTLAPGVHHVTIRSAAGKEIESGPISISKDDLIDSFGGSRLFVYNVAAAHIYRRDVSIYEATPSPAEPPAPTYIAMQRFFQLRGIDYPFAATPESITLDKGSGAVKRTSLQVADLDLNQLAVLWWSEDKRKEAETALRRAVAAQPCGPARDNLVAVLGATERLDEARREARAWLDACPAGGPEADLALQDLALADGPQDSLIAEYRQRVSAHPELAVNQYLYGRALADPAQRIPYFQAALRIDPGFFRAQIDLGRALMALEQSGAAAAIFERALHSGRPQGKDSIRSETSAAMLFAKASIGAGTVTPALELLRGLAEGHKSEDPLLVESRFLLCLAAGRFDDAAQLIASDPQDETAPFTENWPYEVQLLALRGEEAKLARRLAAARLIPNLCVERTEKLLEEALRARDYRGAVAAVDEEAKVLHSATDLHRLYRAAAQLLAKQPKAAFFGLNRLIADLEQPPVSASDRALIAIAKHLAYRGSAADTLAATRSFDYELLPHAYFAIAVRTAADGSPAAAQQLFQHSARTALDLELPYRSARALSEGSLAPLPSP